LHFKKAIQNFEFMELPAEHHRHVELDKWSWMAHFKPIGGIFPLVFEGIGKGVGKRAIAFCCAIAWSVHSPV